MSVALLGGCALFPQQPASASSQRPSLVAPDAPVLGSPQAQAQYHVLAGELAAGRQQPETAAEEFLKALDFAPNAQLAARATALALAANREDLALTAARKWHAIDGNSLDAREVITRLALRAGLNDEAFEQCQAIVKYHPGGTDDGFHHVALLLSQEPEKAEAAAAVLERLVAAYPKLAGAYAAKALLALRQQSYVTAESAAREAVRLAPQSSDDALLLASALIKTDKIDEADTIIDALARSAKNAADVRLAYVRLLLDANHRAPAQAQLEKILKTAPNNGDARLTLGLIALDERRLDDAEAQMRELVKIDGREVDGAYFLGRIAELRDQPQQALSQYEKVTSGNQALDASVRRGALLGRLGRLNDARQLFEQLRRQYPPLASRFYVAEAQMLIDNEHIEDAQHLLDQALDGDPDDDELLYSRSLAYERLGQIGKAEADLQHIIAQMPDDARALNALGFMLTVHSNRYDEAQQLISHALELSPNDPAVIDSAGWVRFKQGHADEALPYLRKALSLLPDPEIAAHLGEALWSLGDKNQAQQIWDGALKQAPGNTVLRETVQRLTR